MSFNLDDVLNVDSEAYESGYRDGKEAEGNKSFEKGYKFGIQKGKEIGKEIMEMGQHESVKRDGKWKEAVRQLLLMDAIDDSYGDLLEKIRTRYKVLSKQNREFVQIGKDELEW